MATRSKKQNLLAGHTANVSLQRNGLLIDVQGVPAVNAGHIAAGLLDALRNLTEHYPELTADGGAFYGSPVPVPDEYDDPDGTETPAAGHKPLIGFVIGPHMNTPNTSTQ